MSAARTARHAGRAYPHVRRRETVCFVDRMKFISSPPKQKQSTAKVQVSRIFEYTIAESVETYCSATRRNAATNQPKIPVSALARTRDRIVRAIRRRVDLSRFSNNRTQGVRKPTLLPGPSSQPTSCSDRGACAHGPESAALSLDDS